MDWLKKTKEEVKVVAAKLQNRRTAFKGEGNVLGDASLENGNVAVPPPAPQRFLKNPFEKKEKLSQEEIDRRREERAKALDARGNTWEKRLNAARNRRENTSIDPIDDVSLASALETSATISNSKSPPKTNGSSSSAVILSTEEMKAREQATAQAHGFNPYQATFSSAGEAMSAVQSTRSVQPNGSSSPGHAMQAPAAGTVSATTSEDVQTTAANGNNQGAVYVILHQDSSVAICAAETLLKLLGNILKNPDEPKFRRLKLANAALQTKLFSVPGGTELLMEAGFVRRQDETTQEPILVLDSLSNVQQTHDSVDVALTHLLHDLN